MDADLKYFEKYIVKKIVSTADYNPLTGKYDCRVHISDDIIREIEDEGVRYGLPREDIEALISQVANHVKASPSVQLRFDSTKVIDLKIGQHLIVHFTHPLKGAHFLDMLVIGPYQFFLLDTSIAGLRFGDELQSMDILWNNAYHIDFIVFRDKIRIHTENTYLRPGKLEHVDLYSPSIIHNIIDSKESYEQNKKNSKDYYLWVPTRMNPTTFSWDKGDVQNVESTFVITEKAESDEATISVNKNFKMPGSTEQRMYLIQTLKGVCLLRNSYDDEAKLQYIKTVKRGKLRRTAHDSQKREWVLETSPQIKFIYEA